MEEEWILVFRAKDGPGGRWDRGELINYYPGTKQFRPGVTANASGNFAFVRVTMTREEVELLMENAQIDDLDPVPDFAASRRRKVNLNAALNPVERQNMPNFAAAPTVPKARILTNLATPARAMPAQQGASALRR